MTAIPGVEAVGLVNNYPPLVYTAAFREKVFSEQTRDLDGLEGSRCSRSGSMFRRDI